MVKEDERGNRPRNGLGTKKKGARAGLESAPLPLEQERHTTCVCVGLPDIPYTSMRGVEEEGGRISLLNRTICVCPRPSLAATLARVSARQGRIMRARDKTAG